MRGSGAMGGVDTDERVSVAAFVGQRQGELQRGTAIALGHHAAAAAEQRLERRGELSPQPRSAPVGGIEEDQIVCVSAGGCAAEARGGRPGSTPVPGRSASGGFEVRPQDRYGAWVALAEQRAR